MADTGTNNNEKKYFCNVCGAEIHKDMKNCPQCFNKVNRWWKTWWGIGLIVLLVAGLIGAIVNPTTTSENTSQVSGKQDTSALAVGDVAQFSGYTVQVVSVSFEQDTMQALVEITSDKTWTCRKNVFKFESISPQMFKSENLKEAYSELDFTRGAKQSITLIGVDDKKTASISFAHYSDKANWSFDREALAR